MAQEYQAVENCLRECDEAGCHAMKQTAGGAGYLLRVLATSLQSTGTQFWMRYRTREIIGNF